MRTNFQFSIFNLFRKKKASSAYFQSVFNLIIFKLRNSMIIGHCDLKISLDGAGFTLVEILVAISILAIIGAVSIPNLNGFNESQILQNTTGDLIRVLREAQSSANSHIQCTSTLIAKEWVVDISSGSYNLKVNCYNPTTAATQTDTHYTPTADSINGVSISTRSPSASPCNTVTFSAEYKPYAADRFSNMIFSCNTNLDSKMEIRLSKTGLTTQYICLDKGGGIYASTAACF